MNVKSIGEYSVCQSCLARPVVVVELRPGGGVVATCRPCHRPPVIPHQWHKAAPDA